MSQCDRVLDYMMHHTGITQKQANDELGCTRLAARISDLKGRGYVIFDFWRETENRYGEPCRVKGYRLCAKS